MQLPLVTPAPLVTAHAGAFRDLFENRCQFRHFQNYLTGLIVLPNKSMANIVRCSLDSADKTNLSRFFSEAPWLQSQVNDRRLRYLRQQTKAVRLPKDRSAVVVDDTLCEHVGSLFEYIARHYNHGDDTFPLAHNPVTSHYVSGPVRFPVDLRLYRRYEAAPRESGGDLRFVIELQEIESGARTEESTLLRALKPENLREALGGSGYVEISAYSGWNAQPLDPAADQVLLMVATAP